MHLPADVVHTWCADLRRWAADEGGLSAEERERAARFRFPQHRHRFVAAHSCKRGVLARYLGCEPKELEFVSLPQGKPELRGGRLRFNLAHTDEIFMLAVSLAGPVGIDVERMRPEMDLLSIARRFFSPAEFAAVAAANGPLRVNSFYRLWTLKEAYIKGTGEGLAGLTQRIDFTRALSGGTFEFDGWRLQPLNAPEGTLASIASRGTQQVEQYYL